MYGFLTLATLVLDSILTHNTYLHAGGDIMLSRTVGYYNKQLDYKRLFMPNDYNPVNRSKLCAQGDCILFFNLESPFHKKDNDIKAANKTFRANPRNIEPLLRLKGSNTMLLSTANNHSNNAGPEGVRQTIDLLQENGIIPVGSGVEEYERGIKILNIPQFPIFSPFQTRLCFTAYSYDEYAYHNTLPTFYTQAEFAKVRKDLKNMEENNCDAKIISYHMSGEFRITQHESRQKVARDLIDAGFDLVLGHHSHVPGDIEKYKGKYIFYSFGNMVFDQNFGAVTCDRTKYDVIKDYDNQIAPGHTCVTPTYIGINALLKIKKRFGKTRIHIGKIHAFGIDLGKSYELDKRTETELVNRIFKP